MSIEEQILENLQIQNAELRAIRQLLEAQAIPLAVEQGRQLATASKEKQHEWNAGVKEQFDKNKRKNPRMTKQ